MAVRNFWIEASVDGRSTTLTGGPQRKDGGMDVTIYHREDGRIDVAARIYCSAYGDKLVTEIWSDGELVASFETRR